MSSRSTIVRSLHDVGAAVWLGGSLMGAIGLNGAASDARNPDERAGLAADGWARWAPVNAAAIAAHVIGGIGLILDNRGRIVGQKGATTNTVAKTVLTGAAVATTAWSGMLGAKIAASDRAVSSAGATEPSAMTPGDVATAQKQLRALQWVTPALTAGIVTLGSQQGEQQKPTQIARGVARRVAALG